MVQPEKQQQQQHPIKTPTSAAIGKSAEALPTEKSSGNNTKDNVCDMCEMRGCKLYKPENKIWNEIDEYVAEETDIAGDSWIPDKIDSKIPNDKSSVLDHNDCGRSCGIVLDKSENCDHTDCGGSCGIIPGTSSDIRDHKGCGGGFGILKHVDDSNGSYPSRNVDGSRSQQPLAPNPTADLNDGAKGMIQKSQDWMKCMIQKIANPYFAGLIFSNHINSMNNEYLSATAQNYRSISTTTNVNNDLSGSSNTINDGKVSPKRNVATRPKKRKKPQIRKKIIPAIKTYRIPTDNDVLMGRGGKSNHHSGNINYRAEIIRTQEEYKKADCIQEKTSISEQLVRRVQANGGNFLEKDERGWYIIDDTVAREKVSQALRDDKDPEKRRAKRQRFLAKRAMTH